jgi:hypothetical protein
MTVCLAGYLYLRFVSSRAGCRRSPNGSGYLLSILDPPGFGGGSATTAVVLWLQRAASAMSVLFSGLRRACSLVRAWLDDRVMRVVIRLCVAGRTGFILWVATRRGLPADKHGQFRVVLPQCSRPRRYRLRTEAPPMTTAGAFTRWRHSAPCAGANPFRDQGRRRSRVGVGGTAGDRWSVRSAGVRTSLVVRRSAGGSGELPDWRRDGRGRATQSVRVDSAAAAGRQLSLPIRVDHLNGRPVSG